MNAITARAHSMMDHPVARKKCLIPTPSIDAFYDRVKAAVLYLGVSEIVTAPTGTGKSSAVNVIRRSLAEDFPRIVTLCVRCKASKSRSEDAFFSNFLDAAGHKAPTAGTIAQKRHRLKQKLLELVERSRRMVIVIFVDEAQHLGDWEYLWLRDTYDELEGMGVTVLVYSVGQPQLSALRSSFQEADQMQIIGRFMVREHKFYGLRSVHDVATCLAGYDSAENTYPTNSGITYTQFFFRRAWDDGLRLVDSATTVWDGFMAAHDAVGLAGELDIPMRYFSRAVRILFLKYNQLDSDDFRPSQGVWQQVIEECDYESSLRSFAGFIPDMHDDEEE